MRKLIIGTIVYMVVAVALSYFFPSFTMKESMGNTLYTVAGIMFSIGLSMTVISSTNSIKNPAFKEPVRKGIKGGCHLNCVKARQ